MADESHQNRPFFPVRGRLPRCPALWRDASHRVRWRDAFHGVPWPGWNRALHRIVTTGPGCNPAFQGDAISTGGSREAWGWSCRRAVAGGETVAQWGGPSGGAPAAEGGSECITAEGTAGQRGGGGDLRAVSMSVQAHEPVLESGGDEALLCLDTLETLWRNERWHLPSRTPAPATCPKTEMRPTPARDQFLGCPKKHVSKKLGLFGMRCPAQAWFDFRCPSDAKALWPRDRATFPAR